MTEEEQRVVNSFQGKEKYEEIMLEPGRWIAERESSVFLLGSGTTE